MTGDLDGLFALIGSKSAVAEAKEEIIAVEQAHRAGAKAMTAAVSLIVLLVVLGSSIAVAAGMGLTGLILNQLYSPMPLTRILGELAWSTTTNFILTAMPFYIMFGEILLRSGIAERMYAALVQWLSWLPGGLMHSNIGSCALFGSVSGSSVATAATIGVVAIGEIEKHKYNERAVPRHARRGRNARHPHPALDQHDHLRRDDRHLGPEALSRRIHSRLHPHGAVQPDGADRLHVEAALGRRQDQDQLGRARIRLLPDLLPPLVLLVIVIGAIFFGLATATESAAVGILGALAITAWRRRLTLTMLRDVCEATVRTTAMVVAILVGAFFLNVVIQTIGLTQQLSKLITAYQLTPVQVLMRGDRALPGPRHLHGRAVDDDLDHPDHHAAHDAGRLRSGLVRHPHRAADSDRDDLAALRHQPVRHPGHPRPRHACPTSSAARRRS